MNVTSLLNRLSNFAPPSTAPAEDAVRPKAGKDGSQADRFGPAARIGLSERAQKLLDHLKAQAEAGTATADEDKAKVRMHRSVAYPLDVQPSPQQLAQVQRIAAKYAYDIRPDAAQRMMDELRQEGLHPEQLANRGDRAGDAADDADRPEARAAERRNGAAALPGTLSVRPAGETAALVA
jgi:hypothetical protein